MNIYTSSWFTKLPPEIQRIGISRGTPRFAAAGYKQMRELAPGEWFNQVDVGEYFRRYAAQLDELDPADVVRKIEQLANGKDAALLCFESPAKPSDWCHRGQLSAWLFDRLQLEVCEYGLEGCGWKHPKLPAQFRSL